MTHSIDDFLGGKVRLKQPRAGLRATSDAVLGAAAVPAHHGQSVLDVGCGAGVIGLCVAARVPDLCITGVEIQPELVELARENATLNCVRMDVIQGNVEERLPELHGIQFHHVVTNPPFYTEDPRRANAQVDVAYKQALPLKTWIDFCLRHLRPRGTFTMIHRIESVPEILGLLNGRLGGIRLIPIYPKIGSPVKRVIIQGVLGSKKPFFLHTGLIMYNDDDTHTDTAEAILRHGTNIT